MENSTQTLIKNTLLTIEAYIKNRKHVYSADFEAQLTLFLNKMLLKTKDIESGKIPSPQLLMTFSKMFAQLYYGEKAVLDADNYHLLGKEHPSFYNHTAISQDEKNTYSAKGYALIQSGKAVIVKLNGGLGTSMGCSGPKSIIKIKNNKSFLDIILNQKTYLENRLNCTIPFTLMNSFNTEADTASALKGSTYTAFNQDLFPRVQRIRASAYQPLHIEGDPHQEWAPPGHGNFYDAIVSSGWLDSQLKLGIKWAFISNSDNTGATLDAEILGYLESENVAFGSEITIKSPADIKGGALVLVSENHKEVVKLLETAQVKEGEEDKFLQAEFFHINNIWINLVALKEIIQKDRFQTALILNPKQIQGKAVIQLESAIGSGIQNFESSQIRLIAVGRERFTPVKTTSDLFRVESDYTRLESEGCISINRERPPHLKPVIPEIYLSEHFKKVADYKERIPNPPSLKNLESLTLKGDIHIEAGVEFRGTVKIDVNKKLIIREGCVLNNIEISSETPSGQHALLLLEEKNNIFILRNLA